MSFASPALLLALLLAPLALAGYLRVDRRRKEAARQFASPRLIDSVAPVRPGWRRHAAMALYGLALAVLVIALARPQATVAVPEERASVVLAIDQSGSMQARDAEPSRLRVARDAAHAFLDDVPGDLRVGGVTFNHVVQSAQAPTTDRDAMRRVIDSLRSSGGTATGEALASSLRLLASGEAGERRAPPSAVVLLSDGASTHGRDPIRFAREARAREIPVYTVALGTDRGTIQVERPGGSRLERVPPDRETLHRIADLSGGRYHEAAAGSELEEVYERLGSRVSTRPEQREITAAFAAGAGLLLLGGAAASLRWFGRLP